MRARSPIPPCVFSFIRPPFFVTQFGNKHPRAEASLLPASLIAGLKVLSSNMITMCFVSSYYI
jgi:hypothetical protein